jgi:hypothetical protein
MIFIMAFLTLFNYFVASKFSDCQLDESGNMLNIYSLVFILLTFLFINLFIYRSYRN